MITISAIMPTYNDAQCIEKSINSLIEQVAAFKEIIIINDGSTDNTAEILKRISVIHSNIQVVNLKKNIGVYESLNVGITYATSDYLLLCASGDWYDQHLVSTCQKLCENAIKPGIICADAMLYQHLNKINQSYLRTMDIPEKNTYFPPSQFKALIKHTYVGFNGSATLMLRHAILKAGKVHASLHRHSTWLLHHVLALRFGLIYVNQIFVYVTLRKLEYGEGKKQWQEQKKVYISFIQLLKQEYPELWLEFKNAAILPRYKTHYLKDFMTNKILKEYLTIRLAWKLLISNFPFIGVAKLAPYHQLLR